MTRVMWQADHQRQQASRMMGFIRYVGQQHPAITNYDQLYEWSIKEPASFWRLLSDYAEVRWIRQGDAVLDYDNTRPMRSAVWFPGWQLNYAQNLLADGPHDEILITSLAEPDHRCTYSRRELHNDVSRVAAWMRRQGVQRGDRIAGVIANTPEAIIIMLATVSIGAIWSSCSPDFGASGIVDRLGQVEPKCVFFTSGYTYNGKYFDCRNTAQAVAAQLPSCRTKVLVPIGPQQREGVDGFFTWEQVRCDGGLTLSDEESLPLSFEPVPFDHPLFILFSSGTTGVPKCIVHGHGGTLLQHKKELMLHTDLDERGRLFYFTTCGWMMWNWMVSGLSTGASLVVYEGSVAQPRSERLWDIVAEEHVTVFGTSPKYLSYCMKQQINPGAHQDLSNLATVLSTGSPLLQEHYQWIYARLPDVHLASISGGTDIVSCFMLGNPLKPVVEGEIQGPGLGMAIEAWDERGNAVRGHKGELVCTQPFPSMPVSFWRDPDGSKYGHAYFNYYAGGRDVWRHGDFVEFREDTGGIIIFGRSDATLNPGGVRIGTAEIYRQVEAIDNILDSLAVGKQVRDDVRIILFVKLAEGNELDERMRQAIMARIKQELTPRHVPARIYQVSDIPYTRSGKKVELAVTSILHGDLVKNEGALANPTALDEFHAIARDVVDLT